MEQRLEDNIAEADVRQVELRRVDRFVLGNVLSLNLYQRERHFRADIGTLCYRPPAAHNADPIGRIYAIEHREEEKLIRYLSSWRCG